MFDTGMPLYGSSTARVSPISDGHHARIPDVTGQKAGGDKSNHSHLQERHDDVSLVVLRAYLLELFTVHLQGRAKCSTYRGMGTSRAALLG